MSLSGYDPGARYKERSMQRFSRVVSMLIVIGMSAIAGFWVGQQYAAERHISFQDQVRDLTQQNKMLQESLTEIRAEAQTANTRYEQIKKEYEAQLPEGPMQDITKLLREQLADGMDPQRLAFLIRSARPPTGCVEPETKRFVVTTPAHKGPKSSVVVADGAIVVSGTGVSAQNENGNPEAWYDPARSVTVSFKAGEVLETKKGTLPLRHSVVVEGREYRFTIEAGARSFARVVFNSCAYP